MSCGFKLGNKSCRKGLEGNNDLCELKGKKCRFVYDKTKGRHLKLEEVEEIVRGREASKAEPTSVSEPEPSLISEPEPIVPIEPPVVDTEKSLKLPRIPKREIRVFNLEDDFDVEMSDTKKPSGTYGLAIPATMRSRGEKVILKKYKAYNRDKELINNDIMKEILLLQHLNQFPDTKSVGFYGIAFGPDDKELYLVLEALETSLTNVTIKYKDNPDKNMGRLPPVEYRKIFYQLLKAFNAIHSLGIIHNDIKPDNIMIKGEEIRIIDFGLAEFLGVGPMTDIVQNYITTELFKAPDVKTQKVFGYKEGNRKSFVSDVYSIGITMLVIAIRQYQQFLISKNQIQMLEIQYDRTYKILKDYSEYFKLDRVFGEQGLDLLFKILNPDTHKRWCAKQALLHPYFSGLDENVGLDRTVVGGNFGIQMFYSEDEYLAKNMELCYLEEIHQNYKDDIIYIPKVEIPGKNWKAIKYILTDWLVSVTTDIRLNLNSFDSFINGFILMNRIFNKDIDNSKIQGAGLLSVYLYQELFGYFQPNFYHMRRITEGGITPDKAISIYRQILKMTDANLPFYPIHCHICYVILKLKYELKDPRMNPIIGKIFNSIGFNLIFFFIHAIPYDKPITTWEYVMFGTIRSLSKLLGGIPEEELIRNPLFPWTTMPIEKFTDLKAFVSAKKTEIDLIKYPFFNKIFKDTVFYGL